MDGELEKSEMWGQLTSAAAILQFLLHSRLLILKFL